MKPDPEHGPASPSQKEERPGVEKKAYVAPSLRPLPPPPVMVGSWSW